MYIRENQQQIVQQKAKVGNEGDDDNVAYSFSLYAGQS